MEGSFGRTRPHEGPLQLRSIVFSPRCGFILPTSRTDKTLWSRKGSFLWKPHAVVGPINEKDRVARKRIQKSYPDKIQAQTSACGAPCLSANIHAFLLFVASFDVNDRVSVTRPWVHVEKFKEKDRTEESK